MTVRVMASDSIPQSSRKKIWYLHSEAEQGKVALVTGHSRTKSLYSAKSQVVIS